MTGSAEQTGSRLRFFATAPHPCSYLPEEEAITLYLDPEAKVDLPLYGRLSDLGFRRSGPHLYRPYCEDCSACTPVRVPVREFKPRRAQRRVWQRNQDLQVTTQPAAFTDEAYQLFARYLTARHADGDMYPPREEQFQSFLVEGLGATQFHEFRLHDQLVCVAVADRLEQGLSAIYTFFEPEESRRSLGVFAVLRLIESCRQLGLRHVYLGYWIEACRKMSYKLDYRPAEVLVEGGWHRLD